MSLNGDGRRLAVGAPFHNPSANLADAGRALIFQYNDVTTQWDQIGSLNGEATNEMAGIVVSLSAQGNSLMVQSSFDVIQMQEVEVNGGTKVWKKLGLPMNKTSPSHSQMSSDGTKVVVGDVVNGSATVYRFPFHLYELNLVKVESRFDLSGTPEVDLHYINSAPIGAQGIGYYRMVLLYPNCSTVVSPSEGKGIIWPVLDSQGKIPTSLVDPSTSSVRGQIDVNTTAIKNSSFYVSSATTGDSVSFCLEMDFYNNEDIGVATVTSKITLVLDMMSSFTLGDTSYGERKPTVETFKYVALQYPLRTFFCNDDNDAVNPTSRFPGQTVQFCVKAPAESPVSVKDVKSVSFKNALVPLLKIEIIDINGKPTNDKTVKTCSEKVCNIKTITFNELYEYDVNNDGILVDVSQGVSVEGTAVLSFINRRRTRELGNGNPEDSSFDVFNGLSLKEKRQLQAPLELADQSAVDEALARHQMLSDSDVLPVSEFEISIPMRQPPPRKVRKPNKIQASRSAPPASSLSFAISMGIVSIVLVLS